MLFPTSGPRNLTVVVAQPDERHANKAGWNGMTDTEQSIIQHLAQMKKN